MTCCVSKSKKSMLAVADRGTHVTVLGRVSGCTACLMLQCPSPPKLLTLPSRGRSAGQSAAKVSLSAGFQIPKDFSATCQQLVRILPAAGESIQLRVQLHVRGASGVSCARRRVSAEYLRFADSVNLACCSRWKSTSNAPFSWLDLLS